MSQSINPPYKLPLRVKSCNNSPDDVYHLIDAAGLIFAHGLTREQSHALSAAANMVPELIRDKERLDYLFAHSYELYWGFRGVAGTPNTREKIDAAILREAAEAQGKERSNG